MNQKTLIYLATPYSHPDAAIREHRFQAVNACAARLMSQGHHVFSPISHTHPIAKAGNLPTDWGFWKDYDVAIMEACKAMYVLMLDGWQDSVGVKSEMEMAQRMNIPIFYIEPHSPYALHDHKWNPLKIPFNLKDLAHNDTVERYDGETMEYIGRTKDQVYFPLVFLHKDDPVCYTECGAYMDEEIRYPGDIQYIRKP